MVVSKFKEISVKTGFANQNRANAAKVMHSATEITTASAAENVTQIWFKIMLKYILVHV